jgi:hypothetical protein
VTIASSIAASSGPSVETRVVQRTLGLGSLVFIMFFTVSGGAYGLEDTIGESGSGMGLLPSSSRRSSGPSPRR